MSQAEEEKAPSKSTVVGIAIVRRGESFLVRRRPEGTVLARFWEFPGGKAHQGERPSDATVRECAEELGFEVQLLAPRRVITHQYPHGRVELHFFDARPTADDAEVGSETGFHWVSREELGQLKFPGANAPVIAELIREVESGPASTP